MIGVFDSGYGGLTVLKEMLRCLPEYDYLYLGDNARSPYGSRSFDSVYRYTLQGVNRLFEQGCPLVILACNTASAKALRNIQQHDLPLIDSSRRVLGVIRPSVEAVGSYTHTGHVGVLGTYGTVQSESYVLEIQKVDPDIRVFQEACPMWVPLVENNEHESPGADYFVEQHIRNILAKSPLIDTLILGCTHYPLLIPKILRFLPAGVRLLNQGDIVAESLKDYLLRHPEMEVRLTRGGTRRFETTDSPSLFDSQASVFLQQAVGSQKVTF